MIEKFARVKKAIMALGGPMKPENGHYFEIMGVLFPEKGAVSKIEPPFVYVATEFGVLRFNSDGYECNPDGNEAEGHYYPQFELPFRPRLSLRGEKIEF